METQGQEINAGGKALRELSCDYPREVHSRFKSAFPRLQSRARKRLTGSPAAPPPSVYVALILLISGEQPLPNAYSAEVKDVGAVLIPQQTPTKGTGAGSAACGARG